ncbi:hypothetical protein A2975_03505 [Candidatus Woesebacteria bacterium RIFCSPLOWO2_01_FULL_44_14]|uniref:Uncharacterized protein n=1 Tax=Candidatus Woesebacteria bacterium RIFCSPLOWO2_01_FULL_44_14 TaxID=1802525 RepID=A0A1F8C1A6_9BACT|nr:MAG: hypothetical protein A2975_03505 [Candidatus Woesebacteria bacterium RIFCSPLOWO2_01_FULL_44_14]
MDPVQSVPPVISDEAAPPPLTSTQVSGQDGGYQNPRKEIKINGKWIVAVLAVLFLVGGVIVGITLIGQRQEIREEAQVACPAGIRVVTSIDGINFVPGPQTYPENSTIYVDATGAGTAPYYTRLGPSGNIAYRYCGTPPGAAAVECPTAGYDLSTSPQDFLIAEVEVDDNDCDSVRIDIGPPTTPTPSPTPTASPSPSPSPTTAGSPTPTGSATPTATPRSTATPTATPKATATLKATATPAAPTTPPDVPESGISTPAIIGLSLGTLMLIFSLALAL